MSDSLSNSSTYSCSYSQPTQNSTFLQAKRKKVNLDVSIKKYKNEKDDIIHQVGIKIPAKKKSDENEDFVIEISENDSRTETESDSTDNEAEIARALFLVRNKMKIISDFEKNFQIRNKNIPSCLPSKKTSKINNSLLEGITRKVNSFRYLDKYLQLRNNKVKPGGKKEEDELLSSHNPFLINFDLTNFKVEQYYSLEDNEPGKIEFPQLYYE